MKRTSASWYVRISVCIIVSLLSAACSKEPEKAKVAPAPPDSEVSAATTVLSDIATVLEPEVSQPAPPAGRNLYQITFSEQGRGVAYIAEAEGKYRVVHNGKADKPYQIIRTLVLSPDGKRVAYTCFSDNKWRTVTDGVEGELLEEVGLPVFSPDSRHIAYDAKIGERWYLVLDGKKSEPCPPHYGYHDKFFSSDSTKVTYVEHHLENNDTPLRVVAVDLAFRRLSVKELQGDDFFYNKDKTRLALVGGAKGRRRVAEFDLNRFEIIKEGPLYGSILAHSFAPDERTVAYVAEKGGKRYLVLNGKEEQVPKSDEIETLLVRPDLKGAGLVLGTRKGYFLQQVFCKDAVPKKVYDKAATLVYNSNGSRHAYVAKKGDNNIFVVVNGNEGPAFDMVVSPMFSPDDKFLVYRARKDGKRFVVVADTDGKILRQHAAYEQVFQPVFTADGKSIAYGVKDGNKLVWKVEKL